MSSLHTDQDVIPRTAFVQGSKEIGEDEFVRRYVPQLEQALDQHCRFVIGNEAGVDNMSLKYLLKSAKLRTPRDITVYLFWKREYNPSELIVLTHFQSLGINVKTGYITKQQRDEALLQAADYFIK